MAFSLSPNGDLMGTITISVQSASPAVNASKTFTFTDAEMARFYAAYQHQFPGLPPITINQALLSWAQSIISTAIARVQTYEAAGGPGAVVAHLAPPRRSCYRPIIWQYVATRRDP
jgi:hypothetical protein